MSDFNEHHRKLERMYLSAPVQDLYKGIDLKISNDEAVITLPVLEKYFHAGMAVHGSIYFRLLDDAAYFSVLSTIQDVFILTSSFHIELLRPVTKGILTSKGRIINSSNQLFLAESIIIDDRGKKVALGKGTFMKSDLELNKIESYV